MISNVTMCTSFRDIDWKALIAGAEKKLDIVVYYWDTWTAQHMQELTAFLNKPKSQICFYFTDLDDATLAQQVLALFPRNASVEDLKKRVQATYQPLQELVQKHHLGDSKVIVKHVPHMLGYALQKIDDKIAVISPFEMYRSLQQIDAPAFVIDLQKAPEVKLFCEKELNGMMK